MTAARLERLVEGQRPRVLLTLGSGLGELAEEVSGARSVTFAEAGLPTSTVAGHAGRLVAGTLQGVPVLVQQGRVHLYEGLPASDVVACVRAAAAAGVDTFVVTNAAGGLAGSLTPGDLMLIDDHLNLTGTTPLAGARFLDMAGAYDRELRARATEAAAEVGERMVQGVYAGLRGPAYETPAEVEMLRRLGADAVGMSTVLEVLAAREAGLRVLGCSLITNVHRPGGTPVDHADVLESGQNGGPRLASVLRALLPRL